MLLRTGAFWAGGAAAPPFVEESSTSFDWQTTPNDPWDNTITIPAGTNRILIDCTGLTDPGVDTSTLDPAGDNIALTELTGSPQNFGNETATGWRLLEANFPATTGSKTLRYNHDLSKRGGRRVIVLSGASQTLFSAGANHDSLSALTVTVNRGAGTFPIGSRVYSWMHAEADTVSYTVSGDVTEVQDIADGAGDRWVFAAGVLGSAQASASATFTPSPANTVRKQAIILVVEAA